VAWQFDRRGVVVVQLRASTKRNCCSSADAGEDIEQDGGLPGDLRTESLSAVREAIEAGLPVDSAELMLVPKTTVAIEDEAKARQVMRLIDALETTTTSRTSTQLRHPRARARASSHGSLLSGSRIRRARRRSRTPLRGSVPVGNGLEHALGMSKFA